MTGRPNCQVPENLELEFMMRSFGKKLKRRLEDLERQAGREDTTTDILAQPERLERQSHVAKKSPNTVKVTKPMNLSHNPHGHQRRGLVHATSGRQSQDIRGCPTFYLLNLELIDAERELQKRFGQCERDTTKPKERSIVADELSGEDRHVYETDFDITLISTMLITDGMVNGSGEEITQSELRDRCINVSTNGLVKCGELLGLHLRGGKVVDLDTIFETEGRPRYISLLTVMIRAQKWLYNRSLATCATYIEPQPWFTTSNYEVILVNWLM
ncbi:hypothetical protein LZ30DRAFT_693503 [Colletotrichum cereale]|nr:hypothetical protein LZ30DRAFT_693503 [Colletotrichum cereale]